MQLQLLLIFTLGCVGQQLAQFVPQDLSKRSAASTGGFALNVFSSECPTGSSIHDQDYCCPNSLVYEPSSDADGNGYCCVQGTSCQEALEQTPYCADTTWTLWNATYQGAYYGYFCCLPGQVGMNNGDCDPAGTIPSPGLSAIMIAASETGVVSGTATKSGTGVIVISSTITNGATATTTTGGNIASKVGSIFASVTSAVEHSEAAASSSPWLASIEAFIGMIAGILAMLI